MSAKRSNELSSANLSTDVSESKSDELSTADSNKKLLASSQASPLSDTAFKLYQKAVRQAVSSSRRYSPDAGLKHYYQMYSANINSTTLVDTVVNSIFEGTDSNERTTPSVYCHGLTIRLSLRRVPSAAVATSNTWNPQFRIIVAREHIPQGGNLITVPDTDPPSDPDSCYSNLGAANVVVPAFIRNPNSFDNWHVYYDKVHQIPNEVVYSGAANTYISSGTWDHTFHFDLHKTKTTFYDSSAGAISVNSIGFYIITDQVSTQVPTLCEYTTDLTFSEAPNS